MEITVNKYPKQLKQSVFDALVELEASGNQKPGDITALAKRFGVPAQVVYLWNSERKRSSSSLTSKDKFNLVVATATMDELSLGEFLRERGILKEDLERWRKAAEEANNPPKRVSTTKSNRATKKLESELRRKEKALAELSALVLLQKKANAIWGEDGDA